MELWLSQFREVGAATCLRVCDACRLQRRGTDEQKHGRVRSTNQVETWRAGLQISVMDTKIAVRLFIHQEGLHYDG
jgi:hypothetical protein